MSVILQRSPADEPYQFMDRKRAEGKPYRVYDGFRKQVPAHLLRHRKAALRQPLSLSLGPAYLIASAKNFPTAVAWFAIPFYGLQKILHFFNFELDFC